MSDIVYKAIIVPMVILIGMYIAGALIGGFLGLPNQFPALFAGVGGIGIVSAYFVGLWKSGGL